MISKRVWFQPVASGDVRDPWIRLIIEDKWMDTDIEIRERK